MAEDEHVKTYAIDKADHIKFFTDLANGQQDYDMLYNESKL